MKMLTKIVSIVAVAILTTSSVLALDVVQFGGEIPWPLSNQRIVTVSHSVGLWKLGNKLESRIFNVEMTVEKRSGMEWIRISEMNPKTYQVVSWGEGFFHPKAKSGFVDSTNSFSNVLIDTGKSGVDNFGRYINMFPNGDVNARPYLLRVVEVKTSIGHVLGMSLIELEKNNVEHFLGTRVLADPMVCVEDTKAQVGLKCEFNLENTSGH